jgi:hypothetical protein
VKVEFAADLQRHQKAVNVVRFSPSGEFLASADDGKLIYYVLHITCKAERGSTYVYPFRNSSFVVQRRQILPVSLYSYEVSSFTYKEFQ